jgi:hypothetical protein
MEFRNIMNGQYFTTRGFLRRITTTRRVVFAWSKALKIYLEKCGINYRLIMITLTYEYFDDWEVNDINKFITKLRKILKENLLAYVWVAEMQKRNVIHYHILFLVKRGSKVPIPDREGFWNKGSSRIETARSPFYICSYVGKEIQKKLNLPKGARVCRAYIKKGILTGVENANYKASLAPKWVRDTRAEYMGEFCTTEDVVRRIKGKWVVGQEVLNCPYELVSYREPFDNLNFVSWLECDEQFTRETIY